jgi:hypothetical protein
VASWQYVVSGTKTAVATALDAASIADATDMDAPAQDLVGNTTVETHFAAAIVSAQAQLAALTGNAPNARVVITGYLDLNVTAPLPAAAASKISVLASEFWS